jgi:hypothetical protein
MREEIGEIRSQLAQEQEANKREINALGMGLGKEAAIRGEFA